MEELPRKYYLLMDYLKQQILTGQIKPGEKLPSENELVREFQVSRHTVRKALSILQQEEYVYALHGKGTFCSEALIHTRQSKNIAVITTYLNSYIFTKVIQGIDRVMTNAGYSILLENTKNSRKLEADYLEELLGRDAEALRRGEQAMDKWFT